MAVVAAGTSDAYVPSKVKVDGNDAEEACKNNGLILAMPKTLNQNEALIRLLNTHPGTKYWIGLERNQSSSPWFWVDGTLLGLSPWSGWNHGNPTNHHDNKSCVFLDTWNTRTTGGWKDEDCQSRKMFYVCQHEDDSKGTNTKKYVNHCKNRSACPHHLQICHQMVGGHWCDCPQGFLLTDKNTCEDVDECINPETCVEPLMCVNVFGSHLCCPHSSTENPVDGMCTQEEPDNTVLYVILAISIPSLCFGLCVFIWTTRYQRKILKRERLLAQKRKSSARKSIIPQDISHSSSSEDKMDIQCEWSKYLQETTQDPSQTFVSNSVLSSFNFVSVIDRGNGGSTVDPSLATASTSYISNHSSGQKQL